MKYMPYVMGIILLLAIGVSMGLMAYGWMQVSIVNKALAVIPSGFYDVFNNLVDKVLTMIAVGGGVYAGNKLRAKES